MLRVYIDMVGDLFHVGHINLFKKARNLFPENPVELVVGVHSDEDVGSYKRRPVIVQEQRYEMIRSCKYVDEVIEASPLIITEKFLKKYKINYVVHGDDVSTEVAKQHKIPLLLEMIKYVPHTPGISTTKIIERIKNNKGIK